MSLPYEGVLAFASAQQSIGEYRQMPAATLAVSAIGQLMDR